jgi:hypothetical protein
MSQQAAKNTWVEVHDVILEKGNRAPQVPEDTKQVPLEMYVKGFLVNDAVVGEKTEIMTTCGRRITGTLSRINPAYTHDFGEPIPELSPIGGEIRAILKDREAEND